MDFKLREKMIPDASFGALILFKTAEEDVNIIESMASTDLRGHHARTPTQKKGVLELKFKLCSFGTTQNSIAKKMRL